MNKPLISIIIPIYNTEKYLSDCIYSCQKQTYSNIQIVLINDGSTDNCGTICKKIAEQDDRVSYFFQENYGVSKARKLGVEKAKGEWIFFVDSDDTITEDAVSLLLENSEDSDIVVANTEDGFGLVPQNPVLGKISASDYTKLLLKRKILLGPMSKLFKKRLFTPFVFDIPREIKIGEDMIMNIRLSLNSNSIVLLPNIVYKYDMTIGITAKRSWRIKDFLLVQKYIKMSFSIELQKVYFSPLVLNIWYNFSWMVRDNLCIRTRIRNYLKNKH